MSRSNIVFSCKCISAVSIEPGSFKLYICISHIKCCGGSWAKSGVTLTLVNVQIMNLHVNVSTPEPLEVANSIQTVRMNRPHGVEGIEQHFM